jgi:hypothetical protein
MSALGTPSRSASILADGLGAGDQRNRAVLFEADVNVFGREAAGGLDVASHADAPAASIRFAFASACRKICQVGIGDRGIEVGAEVAAVHCKLQSVGHRGSNDKVAPA